MPDLRLEQTFRAPRPRVFDAWAHPEVLRRWWGAGPDWTSPSVEVDLRVGGRYRLAMAGPDPSGPVHVVAGEYVEITRPERLVYTWAWESPGAPGGDATTLVTVEFHDAEEGGTRVVLTHSGFVTADTRDQHRVGWAACLANLETRVLEVRK